MRGSSLEQRGWRCGGPAAPAGVRAALQTLGGQAASSRTCTAWSPLPRPRGGLQSPSPASEATCWACRGASGRESQDPFIHMPSDTVAGAVPTGAGMHPTWRHPHPQRRRPALPVLPWTTERTLPGTQPSSGLPAANLLGGSLLSLDPEDGHRAWEPSLPVPSAAPPRWALREMEAASAEQTSLAVGF